MSSLLAYLKQLGSTNAPGVNATSIRVATIVAGKGPLSESATEVSDLLRAYFAESEPAGRRATVAQSTLMLSKPATRRPRPWKRFRTPFAIAKYLAWSV